MTTAHDRRKDLGQPRRRRSSPARPALLYIDLHLCHEVTSPQAFQTLRERGLKVRRPDLTIATMDHSHADHAARPAHPRHGRQSAARPDGKELRRFRHPPLQSEQRQAGHRPRHRTRAGLTQPGMTIVCGDSHTATHGAFGALAFGIGTSQVGHVLATQCLLQTAVEDLRDPRGGHAASPASPRRTSSSP